MPAKICLTLTGTCIYEHVFLGVGHVIFRNIQHSGNSRGARVPFPMEVRLFFCAILRWSTCLRPTSGQHLMPGPRDLASSENTPITGL